MKLPFSFSLKFVFRILLPGFILSLGTFPILQTILEQLNLTITSEFTFSISTFILGWLFVILDMPIYMAFEGRRYWPKALWNYFRNLEEKRLNKIIQNSKSLDDRKYLEASVELRRFPIDENGNYCANFPTRIGNLIAAYEIYSKRNYGIDSIFYWYRIWLTLNQETREEIDNQQALADSTIYVITALNTCGLLCLIYALLKIINNQLIKNLTNEYLLIGLAILAFIGGYILYRSSLHIHATYGEIFKSIFDNYRENISIENIINEISKITGNKEIIKLPQREQYQIAWRYLNNYRIKQNGKLFIPNKLQKILKTQ